ncbi:MAG: SLC13/DASS family transporter [Fimbriimonadaceae bacterium]|nr:SLC13/DASS family transporter [Fimbriimonadaceae bacterium]QYK59233.1 MAG: SLC13/DASS family transporter [Fimbriimonadaceae bacterium]
MSQPNQGRGRLIGALAGLVTGLIVWSALPALDGAQRTVAAIFASTVVLWVTDAMPLAMTALLSTTLLVVFGALPGKEAFGAYGDPIILLFIGSFVIARSMEDSGLAKRVAFLILKQPWATRNVGSVLLALGAVTCLISLFVSNTATTAMMLPIGRTILMELGRDKRGDPVSTSVLLMLTWGASIAVGTVISTPPNIIGIGLLTEATGISINFVQWMVFAMPVTAVMLLFAWMQLALPTRREQVDTTKAHARALEEHASLGRLKPSEIGTLVAFVTALTLWVAPGLFAFVLGPDQPIAKLLRERVPEAVAAILGATCLFLIPARDQPDGMTMSWKRAKTIEWGTVLLFAGGLALGKATFDSGLAKVAGDALAAVTGARDVWTITALSIALAIGLSELSSNTASATTVVPVAVSLSLAVDVNPVPAALGATIGASLGFMLPISTAPNAIVYSTGLIPTSVMFRRGIVFDVVGFFVTFGCLRLVLPLMGLA